MTGFDVIVLLLVGIGAVSGFLRGFVQEILSLAAWIVSLAVIHYLHTPVTGLLVSRVGTPSGAAVLAFALLLLVPYAAIKLIAGRLGEVSRNSLLGPIDRVLGFGFGVIKGMIIVVLVFSILVLAYDTVWGVSGRPVWMTQARTYPVVNASTEMLVRLIAERRRELKEDDAKLEQRRVDK